MATAAVYQKPKSILMTPDPYHVPGYGGYCAQFKYRIGETFGRTTCALLRDSDVASSGRLVLEGTVPQEKGCKDLRLELLQTRTQSWGDQKLLTQMVPGYTGFIPKSQHHFGKRYAENCINAMSDFEGDQRAKPRRETKKQLLAPLKPISTVRKPFVSKNSLQHTMSPFYMNNDNPDKSFVSGYTGFVPRSRGLLGSGYPLITHNALNTFTDHTKKMANLAGQPVQIKRPPEPAGATQSIYPTETGLVPHYTGHIPGEKFRYGNTFGHSTKSALQNAALNKSGPSVNEPST